MECSLDQALQGTLAVLAKVRPEDLDAPTPCVSWDVRALVNHFVGTARWWAAIISGDGDVIDADYAARDFVAAYEESIRTVATAFGADGALARTVRLPFGKFRGVWGAPGQRLERHYAQDKGHGPCRLSGQQNRAMAHRCQRATCVLWEP